MTDLGPLGGRTKTTEDSPPEQSEREIKRISTVMALLKWTFVATMTGLCLWVLVVAVIELTQRAERDRRIDACATAMASESAQEGVGVPIPQCESLSDSERREAAYIYVQRRNLL
jgi:hypothetical protein